MRKFEDAYRDKLDYLRDVLGPDYTSVPKVAGFLHVDVATLRADPSFPVIFAGSRRRVPIDSLARWLTDKEYKHIH